MLKVYKILNGIGNIENIEQKLVQHKITIGHTYVHLEKHRCNTDIQSHIS